MPRSAGVFCGALRIIGRRDLSVSTAPLIFDESAKVRQKARAAANATSSEYDYLRDEVATQVVSRIGDIRGKFDTVLDLGCGSGHVRRALASDAAARESVGTLIEMDAHIGNAGLVAPSLPGKIPLDDKSVGLAVSAGWLHWANDLGGALREACRVLTPDGALLGAMPASGTLSELRVALQLAEDELLGGVSPHVSPFVRARDMGGVLQSSGFALATIDTERLVVRYADMWALMRHLRGMGEGNAILGRRAHFGRGAFTRAAQIYNERYSHALGGITATFELVHFIGWRPGGKQQRPLERGSAMQSLSELAKGVDRA